MGTIDLNLVRAFVAVHESGSFSAAASRLDVPRSTVSRAVSALEESLGVLLFHRTTRKVATTAAGLTLVDRVAPALAALEGSLSDVPEQQEVPTGTLRVATTADLGAMVLAEAVTRFTTRYPDVTVDMHLSYKIVDLVRDNFDLALRIGARRWRSSSLVARRVGEILIKLYASPSYLARKRPPKNPADLRDHDWIAFRGTTPLVVPQKAEEAVSMNPRIVCDDMFVARELARTGAGIAGLPSFVADGDVTAGTLVRVLPRWVLHTGTVHLAYPSRKHVPRRVTAFRDLLLELLRQRPLTVDDG